MSQKSRTHKEEVTLKDIAEAVGKSVAAVSRALNNYDDISPETREYIKRVAREMGYAPTDTLGFILPSLAPRAADPFYGEILTSITGEAARQGFDLLVSTCNNGTDEDKTYLRLINSRRVDGFIIARPRWRDSRIQLLLDKHFPFAVIGVTNISGSFYNAYEDETKGAILAVEHLVAQGQQKIALINTPADLFFSSNFLAGFQQAMEQANLPVEQDFVLNSDLTQKDGYQLAQILLSKPQPPTAFVVADDIVALGVMAAVQDQGLEVGSDILITGYGDILLAEYSQPPLTTIHRPTGLLGQKACQMLTAKLRGEPTESNAVFKPSLVIRQSSDLALWL
jgi:LacI family transcriptional regulator